MPRIDGLVAGLAVHGVRNQAAGRGVIDGCGHFFAEQGRGDTRAYGGARRLLVVHPSAARVRRSSMIKDQKIVGFKIFGFMRTTILMLYVYVIFRRVSGVMLRFGHGIESDP